MPNVDTSAWPYAPDAQTVSPRIDWFEVPEASFATASVAHLSRIPTVSLRQLKTQEPYKFSLLPPEMQSAVNDLIAGRQPTSASDLKPHEVVRVADRLLSVEKSRAAIPVEGCITMLLSAVSSGTLNGVPLTGRDQIDILKFLVNKALPDAKAADNDERARKLDKQQVSAANVDLSNLSREELEDMIARADESSPT